jgi:hypothetical protein
VTIILPSGTTNMFLKPAANSIVYLLFSERFKQEIESAETGKKFLNF